MNYSGTGYFKFLLGSPPPDITYWSNDDSSVGGDEPDASVPVVVTNGHCAVPLGDTTFHANMNNAIPVSAFANNDEVRLTIWFSTDDSTFEELSPDRRIMSAGYALSAATAESASTAMNVTGGSVSDPTFVGTTTNAPLEIFVNDRRAMRIQPGNPAGDFTSPPPGSGSASIVAGYEGNSISTGLDGATISGGGGYSRFGFEPEPPTILPNRITGNGDFGTIGGGNDNHVSGEGATIGGGRSNEASGPNSTIGGGSVNDATAGFATVAGGNGNDAGGFGATVGGGVSNQANGQRSTVPGGFLNVAAGDDAFAAGRRAKANHAGAFVWADSTDADFASTGVDQFLIRAGGGVGIGTPAPMGDLHLASTGSVSVLLEADTDNVTETDQPSLIMSKDGGAISGSLGFFESSNVFELRTLDTGAGVTDFRLAPEGAVEVRVTRDNASAFRVSNLSNSTNADGIRIQLGPTSNPGVGNDFLAFLDGDGTLIGQVEGNGVGGVAYNTTSDRRLKEGIVDLEGALSIVDGLRPREFSYRTAPDVRQAGFIAQEVLETFAQAASGDPGADVGTEPMMIDYSAFTPILTGAVKELKALVEAQQAGLESQQSELDDLRRENEELRAQLKRLEKLEAAVRALGEEWGMVNGEW